MSILISLEEMDTSVLSNHINVLTNLMSDPKMTRNDGEAIAALNDAVALFNTIIANSRGLPLYVRKQVNYGIEKFYPTDKIGESILTLTGKRLFTKEDMRACKALGFNIELAPEELNLDDTDVEIRAKEKLRYRKPRSSKKLNVKDEDFSEYRGSTQRARDWPLEDEKSSGEQVA
jgi:hypothetical protein